MEHVRTSNALGRIEAALSRIETGAGLSTRQNSGLAVKHDRLRKEAAAALSALDELIADIER